MKTTICVFAVCLLCAKTALCAPIIIPSSQLPIRSEIDSWNRFLMLDTNNVPSTNFTVRWDIFRDLIGDYTVTNSGLAPAVNDLVSNQQVIFSTIESIKTNNVAVYDGYDMTTNAASVGNTNTYWWDFGKTNREGQKLIYSTLAATNDVRFLGVTNVVKWQPFSFNVVASGADVVMYFPTNLVFFDTNKFELSGSAYVMTLTNGNLFRMTIQSNKVLETIWHVFGQ